MLVELGDQTCASARHRVCSNIMSMRTGTRPKASLLFSLAVLTVACQKRTQPQPNPRCVVDDDHRSSARGNAGCMILVNGKLLTNRDKETGKLEVPGGTAVAGELAQCTAHRETWEETGFEVLVGRQLADLNGQFKLFSCEVVTPAEEIGHNAYRVPSAVEHEITSVQLLDPNSTVPGDWRFSDSLTTIRALYRQLLTGE